MTMAHLELRYVAVSRAEAAEIGSEALTDWDAAADDVILVSARSLLIRDAQMRIDAVDEYRRSRAGILRQAVAGAVFGGAFTAVVLIGTAVA